MTSFQFARPLAAIALLALFPLDAIGQAPPANDEAAAAYRQGVELRKIGRHEDALLAFSRAHQLQPTARTHAQLGLVSAGLKRWLDAETHLRKAIAAKDDPFVAAHADAIEQTLAGVGKHLGSLEVTGAVAGAEVFLGERRIGTLPLGAPIRIAAGPARLRIRAAGYATWEKTVVIPPEALVQESVVLANEAVVLVAPITPPTSNRRSPRIVAAWSLAAGSAALLAAGFSGLGVRSFQDDQLKKCMGTLDQTDVCQSTHSTRDTANKVMIGGFAAGGALAIAAVVLFAWPRMRPASVRIAGLECGAGASRLQVACSASF